MKLSNLSIVNFRSIVDSGDIRIESLQAFVGENNAGKSNLLRAIEVFLSSGKAGVGESYFFDKSLPIKITATFTNLLPNERKAVRRYLLGNRLILEKRFDFDETESGKVKAEYHGYVGTPRDWWLTTDGVISQKGERPDWKEVAEEHGILDYVSQDDGKVNKSSYERGIKRIIEEREDIEFSEPVIGETQALGLQPVLLKELPDFHILRAITDYSTEIDRRSSSTTFRRLMGDLADRIIKSDPRYAEVESAIENLTTLLNPCPEYGEPTEGSGRLQVLGQVESALCDKISALFPTVERVRLEVVIDEVKEFFSRGVSLKVDDGIPTDVLDKGHGLQRCVVFGLLQTLISSKRGELALPTGPETQLSKSIIIAIEEPELYIHPQMQRIVFGVLKEFSRSEQVIYSTHSPAFVDIGEYHCIGIVRKPSVPEGTKIHQCDEGILGSIEDRKGFQFLNSFGLEQNQMFFAKSCILVEGEEDMIAILAAGRKLGIFSEFPEEKGYTIVVTGGKSETQKFARLLNSFRMPFIVWVEMDGRGETDSENARVLSSLNGNRCIKIENRIEDLVGHTGHFKKTYHAKKYFEQDQNITPELERIVRETFAS